LKLGRDGDRFHATYGTTIDQKVNLSAPKRLALQSTQATDMEAYALPGEFHPDPTDRQLVAAARIHGLRLLTADARMLAYREVQSLSALQ
jgi:PIN domain nuclease of toxin-antitoxin system